VGFELAVDVIKVRQRLGARLTGPGREQLLIQILFAEIFGQRPTQTRFLETAKIIGNRATAYLAAVRDLMSAQSAIKF
jgi:hypothetical protein